MKKCKVLLSVLIVAVALGLIGCTQGQLTPTPIKNALYAARVDAIITAHEVRTISDPAVALPLALKALDRIGGTEAKNYDDGSLTVLFHWFRGTKPKETDK